MQVPLYWLTCRGVDQLEGDDLTEYEQVLEEFVETFDYEEILQNHTSSTANKHRTLDVESRTQIIRNTWTTGAFFYFSALDTTTGLSSIWGRNIQPRFSSISNLHDSANQILALYWGSDAEAVIIAKDIRR